MRSPNSANSDRSMRSTRRQSIANAWLSPANCALGWLLGMVLIVASGSLREVPTARPTLSTEKTTVPGAAPIVVLSANGPTSAWIPSESEWGEQLRATKFASPSRREGGYVNGSNSGVGYTPALRNGLTKALPWEYGQPGSQRVSLPLRAGDGKKNKNGDDDDDGREEKSSSTTYRTMCVRLCDGYYWPVNYAVTKDQFKEDANACARTCGGPGEAKLFSYRNPGGEIEEMEDSDGKAYKKLQNAFLFRTKYEASCKCRPHPWEEAAADRHKAYSYVADARKGDRIAQQKLGDLRVKLQVGAQTSRKAKAAQMAGKGKSAALMPSPDLAPITLPAEAQSAKPADGALPLIVLRKPSVIRGDQLQTGNLRVSRPRTAADGTPDVVKGAPRSSLVRLRLGGREAEEIPVSSRLPRKAADAADGLVVRR